MLTESSLELPKLKEHDKAIIKSRLSGISICDITEDKLKVFVDVSILRISAISGFTLPSTTEFADVINEEFRILLREYGYSNLTFDEILSAFRLNAKGGLRYESGATIDRVKHYSTFFCIDYAAQVLEIYCNLRRSLDYKIPDMVAGVSRDVDYEKYKKH